MFQEYKVASDAEILSQKQIIRDLKLKLEALLVESGECLCTYV